MSDSATVFQSVQVGVEATKGTAVAALKEFEALSIEPAIKPEVLKFAPMGQKHDTIIVPNKEWVTAALRGVLTYDEIVYVLSSVLGYAAPAQQGATAAYLWTHDIDPDDPDTIKAFTVEQGGRVRARRFTYGLVTALGIAFSRNGIELSGEMMGRALTDDVQMSTNEVQTLTVTGGTPSSGTFTLTYDGQTTATLDYDTTATLVAAALEALSNIDDVEATGGPFPGTGIVVEFRGDLRQTNVDLMTAADTFDVGDVSIAETTAGAAPTALSITPVLPTQVDVKVADTQAGLAGATALSRVLSVNWDISNRLGVIWPLKSALGTGFAAEIELKPTMQLRMKMGVDTEGMDMLTYLRAGTSKFVQVKATGDLIAGAYYYDFQLEMCGGVSDVSPFSDEDGLYAIEWTLDAKKDTTWGKAVEVQVINELTAL